MSPQDTHTISPPAAKKIGLDRRIVVTCVLLVALTAFFWLGSRYPALNEKALMGADTNIVGLAFDILIAATPDSAFWWQVVANTINWVYTNLKGMSFGVLFGAGALTLLGLVRRRSFRNPFANAALGAAIGTPLGVCVNCAAPIAQGLHSAGMRLETTLSALLASPTLNVIVVSMSFALLPVYLASIKLAAMLAFILLVVPLLTKFVLVAERQASGTVKLDQQADKAVAGVLQRFMQAALPKPDPMPRHRNWLQAAQWVIRAYLGNFAFVFVVTVPLMLLAGFLGALMITALPFHEVDRATSWIGGAAGSLIAMTALAVFAIILPVPIAFDVILVAILVGAGWPAKYTMTLLVALGSYSIYSYLIIGRAVSYRTSRVISAGLVVLSVGAGVLAHGIETRNQANGWRDVHAILQNADFDIMPKGYKPNAHSKAAIQLMIAPHRVEWLPFEGAVSAPAGTEARVTYAPYGPQTQPVPGDGRLFSMVWGGELGLDERYSSILGQTRYPYAFQGAIAAGDIHDDGWEDIVVASDATVGGVSLYANVGGQFKRQKAQLGPVDAAMVTYVALIDLNGDSAKDLFVGTLEAGTYVFWNVDGGFDADAMITLDNDPLATTRAAGFADLDGDGRLDIFVGNSIPLAAVQRALHNGERRNPYATHSTNRVFWNDGTSFTPQVVEDLPGQTLSVLLSDLNGDNRPDILIGDDVNTTDKLFLNQGGRRFRMVTKQDGMIETLGFSTMSLEAADWNRDGHRDIYLAQTTTGPYDIPNPADLNHRICGLDRPGLIGSAQSAAECDIAFVQLNQSIRSAFWGDLKCNQIKDAEFRLHCAMSAALDEAMIFPDRFDRCQRFLAGAPYWQRLCDMNLTSERLNKDTANQRLRDQFVTEPLENAGTNEGVPNLLLSADAGNVFRVNRDQISVHKPGWSWNGRFTDLDQDGWLDLLVATSPLIGVSTTMPNAFYRNEDGSALVYAPHEAGLADNMPTRAYVLSDFDRDGDLDVIRAPTLSEMVVNRNDGGMGNGLIAEAGQILGSVHGIGTTARFSCGGTVQTRDIHASGGAQSFDSPSARFALPTETADCTLTIGRDGGEIQLRVGSGGHMFQSAAYRVVQ